MPARCHCGFGLGLEHDDVAAVQVVEVVAQLVDEDPVTDLEGRLHRRRRDVERLEQEGLDDDRDDDRDDDQDRPLDEGALGVALRLARGCTAGRGSGSPRRPARTRRARPIRCRKAVAWLLPRCRRRWGLRRRRSPRMLHCPILADRPRANGRGDPGILRNPGIGAGAGRRRRRRDRRARGGATTVASAPRPTSSRSSHAGSLIASTTCHEPSLACFADSWGWLSTTQSAAGASRRVTRGSSGRGR